MTNANTAVNFMRGQATFLKKHNSRKVENHTLRASTAALLINIDDIKK